jgi:soluble lytic murein transglycosylase-like protein
MGIGPSLVIRGAFLGSVLVSLFGLFITAGISFPAPVRAEALPTQPAVPTTPPESQDAPATILSTSNGTCSVSSQFPPNILQWCEWITSYAGKNGLPPDLIAALIWQESGGNPSAYSRSGAVGLMQVMPRDGLAASFMCKNGPCFAGRPSSDELFQPEFNIKFGTRMLAGLLNRNGNIREALRDYGPMDVGYTYADKVLNIYERHRQ